MGGDLSSIREILAGRSGEEMALNDRYLNPQLGRIVRTSASIAGGWAVRAPT